MLLLPLLASFAVPSLALSRSQPVQSRNATYDYVIVGGGTSGLALAARLAEDPRISVAVVEAGGYYEEEGTVDTIIPAFAFNANVSTDPAQTSPIDWDFKSLPVAEANDRVIRYARGKTLGGSSARNLMAYHRGTKGCYDQWAELTGDSSWGWDAVDRYFKKSCTLTPPDMSTRLPNTTVDFNPGACNPSGGPLQVTWPNYGAPASTWFEIGFDAIGVPPVSDFNSGSLNGSAWCATTIQPHEQIRDSAETSYLRSALNNKNSTLKVYEHTMALKIGFTGTTATSVLVKSTSPPSNSTTEFTLHARREIILSAGAFQSPQLLMVSGVGPRTTLERYGIPLIYDAPAVGQNMWDHIYFSVAYQVNVETPTRLETDPDYAYEVALEYAARRDGPLSSPPFGLLAWERLLPESETSALAAAFPADWPTVEYISTSAALDAETLANATRNGAQYAAIGTALVAPLSRGNVSISSDSALDPPVIELGYLTHSADIAVAIAAFKRTREAWLASGITIGDEYQPGPGVQTDEEILAYLRTNISPVWHPAGTCAMGRADDSNAVVDSQARVIGVSNLRVVDASIFPTLPPGHPQSSCYMIAEKIADIIKSGL